MFKNKLFVLVLSILLIGSHSVLASEKGSGGMTGSDGMEQSEEMKSQMKALKNKMDNMEDVAVEKVDELLGNVEQATNGTAVNYEIDGTHSTLGFAVKHLQVAKTRGHFNKYEGKVVFDPSDYGSFKADVTIQVESIDTNLEARDKHLRGADFFDTETHPEITFKSTSLEKKGDGAVIVGDLTMKGVTKEVTIPVELSGPVKSPFGSTVIGINAQTTVNRQDYGISWNKDLDNGGVVVSDTVTLILEIEAHNKG